MKRMLLLLAVLSIAISGCQLFDANPVARTQLDDLEPLQPEKKGPLTIGDITVYDNEGDSVVSGVGLVKLPHATGGNTPPGDVRNMLTERLKRQKVDNVSEYLDSPNYAAVVLTAMIKPGVRKGERVDIEITLPQGSKVKSLRGGVLLESPLMTFSTQAEVRDFLKNNEITTVTQGNRMLRGHEVVSAAGPLHAPLESDNAEEETTASVYEKPLKKAYVWRGGKLLDGRSMFVVLNTDQQRYRMAEQVATRVNETFQGGDTPTTRFSLAKSKETIAIAVPPRYRLNRPHFQRVLRAIPIDPPADMTAYVEELRQQLEVPATAAQAAIRLEALGGAAAVPTLKGGMKSPYPFVRFCAAEALAYLNQPTAAATLAQIVEEHPSLQAYALTALAALDDAAGISRLEELTANRDMAVRYGAFRALRELDPSNDTIRGGWLGSAFALHLIQNNGPSAVHMLSQGRAEITVFGATPKLTVPFSFMVGAEMTLTAREGDTRATLSRFSPALGPNAQHTQCELDIVDIMRTMVQMGATYAEVAAMLTKANERKVLTGRLYRDSLPKAVPLSKLVEVAKENPGRDPLDEEYSLLADLEAATSNLFETPLKDEKPWRNRD